MNTSIENEDPYFKIWYNDDDINLLDSFVTDCQKLDDLINVNEKLKSTNTNHNQEKIKTLVTNIDSTSMLYNTPNYTHHASTNDSYQLHSILHKIDNMNNIDYTSINKIDDTNISKIDDTNINKMYDTNVPNRYISNDNQLPKSNSDFNSFVFIVLVSFILIFSSLFISFLNQFDIIL